MSARREFAPHPEIARQLGISGNEKCVCPSPIHAMACPWGHMTECHYPQDCEEALCSHFLQSADPDFYPDIFDDTDDEEETEDEPRCDTCHEYVDECQCDDEDDEEL